jgi:iron(III) transport system substrate-binding protein
LPFLRLPPLPCPALAEEVVVYSARNEQLIKPLFDAYTRDTGVQVKFITDKEGPLMARLKAEGRNTRADMLLTVDAGNLWQASEEGLLRPIQSKTLETNVPKPTCATPTTNGSACRCAPAPWSTTPTR